MPPSSGFWIAYATGPDDAPVLHLAHLSAAGTLLGETRPLAPGDPTSVGPFQLLGRLGTGGMGEVFLGRLGDGPLVAVKVIHRDLGREATHDRLLRTAVAI